MVSRLVSCCFGCFFDVGSLSPVASRGLPLPPVASRGLPWSLAPAPAPALALALVVSRGLLNCNPKISVAEGRLPSGCNGSSNGRSRVQ